MSSASSIRLCQGAAKADRCPPGRWLPSQQELALGLSAQQCLHLSHSRCVWAKKRKTPLRPPVVWGWSCLRTSTWVKRAQLSVIQRITGSNNNKYQDHYSFFLWQKGLDPTYCWAVWLQSKKALIWVLSLSIWVTYKGAICILTESRSLSLVEVTIIVDSFFPEDLKA